MAANESDREDLMREAVALHQRIELSIPDFNDAVTMGFRENDALSVFVAQAPVYQFDPAGRLRRAFVDGLLFRSQHDTLAQLRRVRTPQVTQLLRTDLTEEELRSFRDSMQATLRQVLTHIQAGQVTVLRVFPEHESLLPKICDCLETILGLDQWLSPLIRRR